jgi:hypothetical protein
MRHCHIAHGTQCPLLKISQSRSSQSGFLAIMLQDMKIKCRKYLNETEGTSGVTAPSLDEHFNNRLADLARHLGYNSPHLSVITIALV